ncbi:hypothetical protein [Brevibacillus sp. HD1.4A]|uniref:hypothetical protein n=1 Tax=Brevibacillus sp. HD1.4A TaxID=2738978 RepID=UPI00156B895F|nr:hypothetical protein [Brevibacillus sp. HD1.4A]NRQ53149.1 hypothetical protein [Brevibacillus sp. HD1.4A]
MHAVDKQTEKHAQKRMRDLGSLVFPISDTCFQANAHVREGAADNGFSPVQRQFRLFTGLSLPLVQ